MAGHLLHPEIFEGTPVIGSMYADLVGARAEEVHEASIGIDDPNVTVVIRTRNHAHRLEGLLEDINRQAFEGEVQLVVVDTESSDATPDIARQHGATVRGIAQADFNYALSLNKGFEYADHPYVLSLVGHSRLSNDQTLRSITRWSHDVDLGGAFGAAVPDSQASLGDFIMPVLQKNHRRLSPATPLTSWEPGALSAHRSVVSTAAWKELGGYDEAFGDGGEDVDLAKRMLEAGMTVVREPGLSVHHSYGLNLWNTYRQVRKLLQLRQATPEQFDQRILSYRPDMADPKTRKLAA